MNDKNTFKQINEAVQQYLATKSTSDLTTCLNLIKAYVEIEVDVFLTKHKSQIETALTRDDLISEAWIRCYTTLMNYKPDSRPFTYLMAFAVHTQLPHVAGKEQKHTDMKKRFNNE